MPTVHEKGESIREAVGVFPDVDKMQAAIQDLQRHGFMRQEFSVLAGEAAGKKEAREIADDPKTPRTAFIGQETFGIAGGVSISVPLYVTAAIAAGVTIAAGGSVPMGIFAAVLGGSVGAAAGLLVALLLERRRKKWLEGQMEHGGLLLWVNLRTPDMDKKARKILRRHDGHYVHVHKLPLQ